LGVTLNRKIPDTESNDTWLCREATPAMPETFAPPPKTIAARDQEPAQRLAERRVGRAQKTTWSRGVESGTAGVARARSSVELNEAASRAADLWR